MAMQRLSLRSPRPCAAVAVRSTSSSATAAGKRAILPAPTMPHYSPPPVSSSLPVYKSFLYAYYVPTLTLTAQIPQNLPPPRNPTGIFVCCTMVNARCASRWVLTLAPSYGVHSPQTAVLLISRLTLVCRLHYSNWTRGTGACNRACIFTFHHHCLSLLCSFLEKVALLRYFLLHSVALVRSGRPQHASSLNRTHLAAPPGTLPNFPPQEINFLRS